MNIEKLKTIPIRITLEESPDDERFSQDGNPTSNARVARAQPQENSNKEQNLKNREAGISEMDRKKISDSLAILLADTYILYLKTQNYHWNVTGPNFLTLHTLFMSQYSDLSLAIDLIAERIRALGQPAPGTFLEFSEMASVKENRGVQQAEQMIKTLNTDQGILINTIRNIMSIVEKGHDFTTADLLTQRLQVHEKNAWMLGSFIK